MNPLHWKREHQLALVVAMGVGAVIGLWLSWNQLLECKGYYTDGFGDTDFGEVITGCVNEWLLKPLLGALIGGAGVLVRQLLRS